MLETWHAHGGATSHYCLMRRCLGDTEDADLVQDAVDADDPILLYTRV